VVVDDGEADSGHILLADDHTVVRHGLPMVLDAAPDLEVVAEASNGIEATERALRDDTARPRGAHALGDPAGPRRALRIQRVSAGSSSGSW
jgi:hypothetical protein